MEPCENFTLARKFYRVRLLMTQLSSKMGIPQSEFCLMHVIAENNSPRGISVSQIAAALEVSPPAVSRTLKSLESRGLTEQQVNVLNRRSSIVKLTDSGKEFLNTAHENFIGMMDHIRVKMGNERLNEFNELFEEILNLMSEYVNDKEVCSDDKNA